MSYNPQRRLLRRRARALRALDPKPVGMWGWRVQSGARGTRVTGHGGRAHTVYSFAMKADVGRDARRSFMRHRLPRVTA